MASPFSLETVAAPPANPVPFNSASSKSFVNDYYKLGAPNLSMQDRKQIRVIGLVAELKANSGTDYTNNISGLIQDAQVYTGSISNFDLEVAEAVTDWNAGKVADATVSTDLAALNATYTTMGVKDNLTLDRIIAFLKAATRR